MPHDPRVQEAARSYVSVQWLYDGLGGSVIRWTHDHGNKNEDPSVLAWVLDPHGEEIANLSGVVYTASALGSALEEQAKTSFPLVDPARFNLLRRHARAIAARKRLGGTMAKLRAIVAGGDPVSPEEKDEAERMLAAIAPHVEWRFRRAEELKEEDPPRALEIYRELAADFRGDEIGDRADGILTALKKDEAFQAERKAHGRLTAVRDALEGFKPCSGDKTLRLESCRECREKNDAALREVVRILKGIRTRWPDTRAAEAAGGLLGKWGVP